MSGSTQGDIGRLAAIKTPTSTDLRVTTYDANGNQLGYLTPDQVASSASAVDGPASATDNAITRFDGTTGKLVQNSVTTIADTTGSVVMGAALGTVVLKQGSNGKTGTFTLNGATPVVVGNTSVTANSCIIITLKTVGGTVGAVPAIQTITASTGFTVAGTASDTSVYNYAIIESAA